MRRLAFLAAASLAFIAITEPISARRHRNDHTLRVDNEEYLKCM